MLYLCYNRAMKKILAFMIVLAFLCGGCFACVEYLQNDIYETGEEFQAFADRALNERVLFDQNKYTDVEYAYGGPFSTAIRKDKDAGEDISSFRDEKINSKIKDCHAIVALGKEEKGVYACVIDSSVKSSGNGAASLVIYTRLYGEKNEEMALEYSEIGTYLFSEETGEEIEPVQALNVNFRYKASRYAEAYFENTFSEDRLTENWKDYITENDDNFNRFIMTGNSIVFYFRGGTVVKEEQNIISLKIPYRYMQSAIRPGIIDRYLDPDKPMVALTYDDGPGGESEARILDCLEKHGCVATFFYQGSRIKQFGDNAVRAAGLGCEIGNHSWDHPQLSLLSGKKIRRQIERTNDAIYEATGVRPSLIRPPYGDFSDKVTGVIRSEHMSSVLWTIDTLDWKTKNPEKIFKSVRKTRHLDGKIILMHSIYDETAKATEKIVPWLEENGYQTVTITELLKYKKGRLPKAGETIRVIE